MSRVVRFKEVGGPEKLEICEEVVANPAEGEVRIKIKAIGLNRAESLYRSGKYFENPIFPAKLGYEAAGTINAVGPGVVDFQIGDIVSVVPNFSFHDYGFYGDTAIAPVASLVKHPPQLSFEEAASIWMMFLTAYDALIGTAKLKKGEFVLIPAASSSVGLASIQLANLIGAVPVALTRTNEKMARLLEAGAAHVIATDEQDVAAEVLKITEGKGFQVLYDPVGGPTFAKLLEVAAPQARIIMYGTIGEPTVMPHFPVFTKMLTITGALLFTTTSDPDKLKAGVAWVVQGLESGKLRPVIAETFAFDQIVEAHRYLESNKQFGKIIVTV
jgi:NADPH:quinone reductase-like Zn-dependent oxidoreductase